MAARMGERNNRATCSDAEIDMAIELVVVHKLSRREVAKKFEVNESTVRRWVAGHRRVLRRS